MTDIEAVIQIRLALKARHIKNLDLKCESGCDNCLCDSVCTYIGIDADTYDEWLANFEQFKSRVNLHQTLSQLQKLYPEYFL